MTTFYAFLILLVAYCAVSVPVPTPKIPSKEMVGFMKQYGYIVDAGPDTDALYTEEGFKEAIRVMQRYGGLPETGDMDEDTLELMTAPRCGVPDVIRKPNEVSGNKTKRYVIGSPGWRKRTLTYFLANWPPELDPETTSEKLKNAFQLWSNITPLKFLHKQSMDADLIIAFGRGPHGDGYPFDGRGSILAHAFFPYEHGVYGGDVHFDDDEHWIDGSVAGPTSVSEDEGVDFFTVATHEIGHSLGLAHSTVSGSIMFPYYKGYNKHMRLDYDDIVAMYEMYVMRGEFEDEENVAVVTDEPANDDVSDGEDDDVYSDGGREDSDGDRRDDHVPTDDGTTYAPDIGTDEAEADDENVDETQGEEPRKDDGNYPSEDEGDEEDEDKETDKDHAPEDDGKSDSDDENKKPEVKGTDDDKVVAKPRTPPNVCEGSFDAASLIRGELFIFKGLYMWRMRDMGQVMNGYPVYFHVFFRGLPWAVRNIDAVYQRPQDYSIVFFTGRHFWVFDGNSFSEKSPQPLTDLGLPEDLDRIDAAIVWAKNGKTYLFRGALYWKYDEVKKRVEHGYPQRIYRWKGVPETVDSAFTWKDGQTYFFKGSQYWRFNNQNISTDADYPQPTAPHWLSC